MCLETNGGLKTATKDIVCFKTVVFMRRNEIAKAQFDDYIYGKDIITPTDIMILRPNNTEGGEKYLYHIEKAFHSWSNPIMGNSVFIIPKGALYYKGEQFDNSRGYASNMIKFVGKANFFERLLYKIGIKNV